MNTICVIVSTKTSLSHHEPIHMCLQHMLLVTCERCYYASRELETLEKVGHAKAFMQNVQAIIVLEN